MGGGFDGVGGSSGAEPVTAPIGRLSPIGDCLGTQRSGLIRKKSQSSLAAHSSVSLVAPLSVCPLPARSFGGECNSNLKVLGDGGLHVGTFWHGRLCCICRLGSIGKLSCVAFWIKLVVSSPAVLPDTTTINFLFIVGGILVVSTFGHPLWPPLEAYHFGALVAWLGSNAVARLVNTTGASRRVVTVSLFRHTLA